VGIKKPSDTQTNLPTFFSIWAAGFVMKHGKSQVSEDGEDILETAVSFDGTWQRRGFTSLNGCVTVISMENGKCWT
jgi:hypothetical protein